MAEKGVSLGRRILARIDPNAANELLFKKLPIQADEIRMPDETEMPKAFLAAERETKYSGVLLQKILQLFTSSVLGATVSPRFGKDIILSRLSLVADILINSMEQTVKELKKEIAMKKYTNQDIERLIDELLSVPPTMIDVIEEASNRLITLAHINLPPEYRPAMANIRIGYEIIGEAR